MHHSHPKARTAALLLAAALAFAAPAGAAEPTLLRINSFPNAKALPLQVGIGKGFFAKRGLKAELGLSKSLLPARGTRKLSKSDMMWNDFCPNIRVDPQTFDVYVDGEIATCEPARELPLTQRYMLR